MNWGKGIILGMLLFMGFIISMAVYMLNMPTDDYDHQYYEKGLNYNKDYAKEMQVVTDNARPVFKQLNHQITIQFTQPAVGTVRFINPLGKSKDVLFKLDTGTGTGAALPLNILAGGRWAVRMEWSSGNNKQYLFQQDINVNGN